MEGGTHTKQVPSPEVEKLLQLIGWLRSAEIKTDQRFKIKTILFIRGSYLSVGFGDVEPLTNQETLLE